MSTPGFEHLLSPLRIGNVTVRNRALSTAHGTGMSVGGQISDRLIEYHRARARGGIGLVIMEATSVDQSPIGAKAKGANLRSSDAIIPGYRRIADALHAEGAKVFTMLSHSGRNTSMGADGEPPVAPSPIPMDRTRDIPHELTIEEIGGIVRAFAAAALRAREGGLDGVELSFTHGNLVQAFLSPASNKRQDAYGGSEEKRLRFAREVLEAVRAAVGPDFVVGIRYSATEIIPDGYGIEEGARYAALMAGWGRLDFIDVSAGTNASMWSRSIHYPTIASPQRPLVPYARAVKKLVDIPVFCIGKIADPREAEAILRAGDADMVGMTRAHISEPAIIRKIMEGRVEDIRTCIHGNEACFSRQQRVGDITCVYNPRTGREYQWEKLAPTETPKSVLIVGGGPAGLEAARVAAKRGHDVVLHERSGQLGGQVRLLARTPYRQDYMQIVTWLERQARKAGTLVRLNSEMTAEKVLAAAPDVVILATGAADARPEVPGAEGPSVFTGREVLAGANLGKRVVLGDWDGRHMGMSVAEALATRGHEVEIVTSAFYVGMDADLLTWRPAYDRLLSLGVRMSPLEEIVEIGGPGVTVQKTNGSRRVIEADSVVLCSKGRAEASLYHALKGAVKDLHAVGDCWAPRQLEQAIFEGSRAARQI
ncbi:MAG: FAD-dependent oxidoreductase [Alphaproteobacteria bacterium]|nr:FAD-dependent oxidoreductase [Alphaproteobacteria bacterium]